MTPEQFTAHFDATVAELVQAMHTLERTMERLIVALEREEKPPF